MDTIENSYQMMLERLHILDQSIYILNLVNNDLRKILHKEKPLPKFIRDSFKRSISKNTKTSPALPPPPTPIESEEIRLAASVIDKAKRTIENVGDKKQKKTSTVIAPDSIPVQPNTARNNRPKTASSVRPSSAGSTIPPSSDSSASQQQQPVRRYVPAHMKAPFQTQPEKKRRPSSSVRNSAQTNSNQKTNRTHRSSSQQRRQSLSSNAQSVVEIPQETSQISSNSLIQNEKDLIIDNQNINNIDHENIVQEHTPTITNTEEPINIPVEITEIDTSSIPQPIILNQALIKPLRRLWKQNQNLRSKLERQLDKKSTSSPLFINRLNEQIHSSTSTNEIHIPNIDVLLQLAIKLRAIVLYLLENSTFDDLDGALKRLNTVKYLVNQYNLFFTSNINIHIGKHHYRSSNTNLNIDECINKLKSPVLNRHTILYTDDSQLIAFTEVRFKQFENECRWIELNWHEEMIIKFKQTLLNKDQNPLQIYRELMSLITGLQTSTPIVVENRFE